MFARRELVTAAVASQIGRTLTARPRPLGLGATPRDLRPVDPDNGRRILAGAFVFGGESLTPGPHGDPWDRAYPSRRFAVTLHQFGWLGDLIALGDAGATEGLRLALEWRRVFGGWNAFAWSPQVLERRVFNLACGARAICRPASEAETLTLTADLARQARVLLALDDGPQRRAERATAAALAAAALGGPAARRLLAHALQRLAVALPDTVTPDGGHASRSPQAAMELFFDLQTLDDALTQRGASAPDALLRALDRLDGAVRFLTLADGGLAALQGGEAQSRTYVAAARAQEGAANRTVPAARNGYHRLQGQALQVIADAAAPAPGGWSVAACAQPLAIEVLASGRRLIVASGWSPAAAAPAALRLVDAASTASLADATCGEPLRGFAAEALGARLRDTCGPVEAERRETPAAAWLELSHDGWARRFGLRHERRLYLDRAADELRGEDTFRPLRASRADGRRFAPFTVRFHLHPRVSALISQDRRGVLLKADGDDAGWWLRTDALEIVLEPSTYIENHLPRRSQQIVLRGQVRLGAGAQVRWKLSSAATPTSHIDDSARPA